MGFIYLVTNNINKKIYIGKTINSIGIRWSQHKSEAKRLKPNVYFVRAIHKYGPENFTVESLEECENNQLSEREKYYIKLYNSNDPKIGYNSTLGGEGAEKYETEEILKLWNDGLCIFEIAKELNCHTATVSSRLHSNGITEKEIRLRGKIKNSYLQKKKIYQYSVEGKLVGEYESVQDACEKNNYSESNLRRSFSSMKNLAYGYLWSHQLLIKEEVLLILENQYSKKSRPILQYNLDGTFIKRFKSCTDASRELNVSYNTIGTALNNTSFQGANFLWKYEDDPEDIMEKVKRNKNKKNYWKKKVSQYDLNNNFIQSFDSALEAANYLNKSQGGSSITKACKGKLKTAYGYIWKYSN